MTGMGRVLTAEFIGTFALIFMGAGRWNDSRGWAAAI